MTDPDATGSFVWGGGPPPLAVGLCVLLLVTGIAAWRLGALSPAHATRTRAALLGAAVARGLAATLAALACLSPATLRPTTTGSELLVATGSDVGSAVSDSSTPSDLTIHTPGDARTAAAAVEVLRAARAAERSADVVLDARALTSADANALGAALRSEPGGRVGVLPPTPGAALPPPGRAAPTVRVPAGTTADVPFTLSLTLHSAGREPDWGGARMIVLIDGTQQSQSAIPASAARAGRAETPPITLGAGAHQVVVQIEGHAPAAVIVPVSAAPRVVVLRDPRAGPSRIAESLRVQGLAAVVADPSAPATWQVGGGARDGVPDVVVLEAGRPVRRLSASVIAALRQGAGLLLFGGAPPYGLERLRGDPLAAWLPIDVPPPTPPAEPTPPPPPDPKPPRPDPEIPDVKLADGPKRALRVALLLCLDRSGSMAGDKLRMAQQSAVAAAEGLDREDRVAVIAFDDEAFWVAPFQPAGDVRGLIRKVAALTADGGTNFYPALKMGYEAIKNQPVGIRHIILLTDGVTREAVFNPLIDDGVKSDVTLSTIGVGDGADMRLLARLAGRGRGRLYPALDPRRVPQVVTLDTRRFGGDVRDERRATMEAEGLPEVPVIDTDPGAADPESRPAPEPAPEPELVFRRPAPSAPTIALEGLMDARWPRLPAAEDLLPRATALVGLEWEDGGAALALGRRGPSRVAVLGADVSGDDAAEFWAWEDAGRLLAQLVRQLAPDATAASVHPRVRAGALEGGGGWVRVDDPAGGVLVLESAQGAQRSSSLRLVLGPGAGTASAPARVAAALPAGIYGGTWESADRPGDAVRVVLATGAVAPGPQVAESVRRALEAAGATTLDVVPERTTVPGPPEREPAELPLLGAAAVLLVVESLVRRRARAGLGG